MNLSVETERPQTVTWNPKAYDQVTEARKKISSLTRRGFILEHEEDGEARLVPPELNENIGFFRILSDNGDDRVVWDRRIPEQVKEAFKRFKELMSKGYTAYVTYSDGSRGHKITEFDPGLEEIILGKSGGKEPAGRATLVPKTKPG